MRMTGLKKGIVSVSSSFSLGILLFLFPLFLYFLSLSLSQSRNANVLFTQAFFSAPSSSSPSFHTSLFRSSKISSISSTSSISSGSFTSSISSPSLSSRKKKQFSLLILSAKSKVKAKGGLADSRAAALAALEELEKVEMEMEQEEGNNEEGKGVSTEEGKVLDKKALKAAKKAAKQAKKEAKKIKIEQDEKEVGMDIVGVFDTEQDWDAIENGVDVDEKKKEEMEAKKLAPQTGDGGAGGLSKKQQMMTARGGDIGVEKDLFVVKNDVAKVETEKGVNKKIEKERRKQEKKDKGKEKDDISMNISSPSPSSSQSSTIKDAKEAAMAALAAWDDDEEEDVDKKSKKEKKKEEKKLAKMEAKMKKKEKKNGKKGGNGDEVDLVGEGEEKERNDDGEKQGGSDITMKQEQDNNNNSSNNNGNDSLGAEKEKEEPTLEQRIRASKPPAKIRISNDDLPPGQVFVRLQNIGVVFRNQQVLDDVTWQVQTGDRLGVVGPNGAGKSTQLKIMAGELDPTTGEVIKSSKNLKLAFLRQEFTDELEETRTLEDEFMSVFIEENQILEGLAQVEKDLEKYVDDADEMQNCLERLSNLQNEAERKKVYSLSAKVDRVLEMMGFVPEDAKLPVSSFSGGWKMRIGLGKVLLQEPSVLLLDEPTNHLDLESVEWLETFLSNQGANLPMAIVSHDREFLDKVCNRIIDTDLADATSYNGDYSNFIKQKKVRIQQWQASYDNQQKKIREDKQFINRWKGDNTKTSAISKKQQAIDRLMASPDLVKRPPSNKIPFKFRFPAGPRVTGELGYVEKMSHKYGENHLFEDASLRIEKGDRIAIVGPNGSGKSTLLRLLMGMEKPSIGGKAEISGYNVVTNYFQQSQADTLDMNKTVEEVITESSTTESYNELRALMAQFLFKGDTCKKKIANLSGGEKARVALCNMMLTPANVLILDEPTNHLDIPAKEMLEEALQYYDGAIVIVSHDRYFISQVATKIVAVEDKKLVEYYGDYKYYMEKNAEISKKVESRYVDGLEGIQNVKQIDFEELREKKNFGGKGGPSGNKTKGIKNAKRMNISEL